MTSLMVGQVLYGCPDFAEVPWDEHRVEAVGGDWVVARYIGNADCAPAIATGPDVHERLARYLAPPEDEA